jgi:hypothetical protein
MLYEPPNHEVSKMKLLKTHGINVTVYKDRISGIEVSLNPLTSFTVSLRRSNGRRRTLYHGKDAQLAFEEYHKIAVFKFDRKYLSVKETPHSPDRQLLAKSGEVPKLTGPDIPSKRPDAKKISLMRFKRFPVSKLLPATLYKEFALASEQLPRKNGKVIPAGQVLAMLIAHFVQLPSELREQLILESFAKYRREVIKSGGDMSEDDPWETQYDTEGEDLL